MTSATEVDPLLAPATEEELAATDPLLAPATPAELADTEMPNGDTPDMAGVKSAFEENFKKADGEKVAGAAPKQARTFMEAVEAGFDISVSGLVYNKEKPDVILPEDAHWFHSIASQVATMAGDAPAMLAGAIEGAAIGTAVAPGIGTAVGAGAGGFALPEALRTVMMDHYEKGDIKDFKDFWSKASSTFLATLKGGVIGGVSAGVGHAAKLVAKPAFKTLAQSTSEVATMVTVGKAIEGEVPKFKDFTEAAIMLGGLHAVTHAAPKLMRIYAKTGMKPAEIVKEAQRNPVLRQEILNGVEKEGTAADLPAELHGEKTEFGGPERQIKMSAPDEILPLKEVEAPKKSDALLEAEKKIDATIGKTEESKPTDFKEKAENLYYKTIEESHELYTKQVDSNHPLEQALKAVAEGKKIPATEDFYKLARVSQASDGMAKRFLEYNTIDFKTREVVGESLKSIYKEIDDPKAFERYAQSERAIEIEKQGKTSGKDLDAAKLVVKEYKAQYGESLKKLVKYQNEALKYLRDSEVISREAYTTMFANGEHYIPYNRVLAEAEARLINGKLKNPVKNLKGSEKNTQRILDTVPGNTLTFVKMAELNRVALTFVKAMEANPEIGGTFIEKVKAPIQRIEAASELNKLLAEHGIEGHIESFEIFRATRLPLAKGEFQVFRDGKREVYKAHPLLAEALSGVRNDPLTQTFLVKMLAPFANTLKFGAILNPEFAVRNPVVDSLSAWINDGAMPVFTQIEGLRHIIKKDEVFQKYLSSGAFTEALGDLKKYTEKNFPDLDKETGLSEKVWNVVKSPLDAMQVAVSLSEQMTRVGVFAKNMKGKTGTAAEIQAALKSRDATVDFLKIGARAEAWNKITAFYSVGVNSVDRMVQQFREDPKGTTIRTASAVTTTSLLLWWANKDDPRVQDVPRWQKDMFWIIPTDSWQKAKGPYDLFVPSYLKRQNDKGEWEVNRGAVYRIKKPHMFGTVFGSLTERILDGLLKEDPHAFDHLDETIASQIIPNVVPTATIPIIEQFANRSTFTGQAIRPESLKNVYPEYQYTDYTSETAKQVGKFIASIPNMKESAFASPAIIETYVRDWSGGLGTYALQLMDIGVRAGKGMPAKPAATLSDIPFIKAYVVRYPSASAQSIQDFYDRSAQMEVALNTVKNRFKEQQFDEGMSELALAQSQGLIMKMTGMRQALSKQTAFIHAVYNDKKLSGNDKRQLIDGVYFQMIQETKLGNKLMDEVSKRAKAARSQ